MGKAEERSWVDLFGLCEENLIINGKGFFERKNSENLFFVAENK